MAPDQILGAAWGAATSGNMAMLEGLELDASRDQPLYKAIYNNFRLDLQANHLQKAISRNLLLAEERSSRAIAQGTYTNEDFDTWGLFNGAQNTREKQGLTFAYLRYLAQDCEPIAAIISKRVSQVLAFSRPAVTSGARVTEPGYRIRLTDRKAKPTEQDKENMSALERYIRRTGVCPPPEQNRRAGWQPGFAAFLAELVRDSLTIDHVAVRRWTDINGRLVAFACEDAGLVLPRQRELKGLQNGVPNEQQAAHDRLNTSEEIAFVRTGTEGGIVVEEFTAKEMFVRHRRSRTDRRVNGFGFSEIEEYIHGATMWVDARDFNKLRWKKNSLPRGVLAVAGQMSDAHFKAFKLDIARSMSGLANAWNIPVVRAGKDGTPGLKYERFDDNARDMEHSQTLFLTGLWAHILYQISPDETGFQAGSPFRPPLSEASPETNLKYSQDTGLRPLLRWLEDLINDEILWVLDPSERYTFEFVGLGDYDAMADIQMRTARLQAGLSTPELEWAELDVQMPDDIASHPASKLPGIWAVNLQLLNSMSQQQAATEAQQAQGAMGIPPQAGAPGGMAGPGTQGAYTPYGGPGDASAESGAGMPVGTPPGTSNPAQPVLKAMNWPLQ